MLCHDVDWGYRQSHLYVSGVICIRGYIGCVSKNIRESRAHIWILIAVVIGYDQASNEYNKDLAVCKTHEYSEICPRDRYIRCHACMWSLSFIRWLKISPRPQSKMYYNKHECCIPCKCLVMSSFYLSVSIEVFARDLHHIPILIIYMILFMPTRILV